MHIPRDIIQSGTNWYLYTVGTSFTNFVPLKPANYQTIPGITTDLACRVWCDFNPCLVYISQYSTGTKTSTCGIVTGQYALTSMISGPIPLVTMGVKMYGTGLTLDLGAVPFTSFTWNAQYMNYLMGGVAPTSYYACQSVGYDSTDVLTEVASGSNCATVMTLAPGHYRSADGYQNCDIRNAAGWAFSCDPKTRLATDCVYGSGFYKGICTLCPASAPYAFGQSICYDGFSRRLPKPPVRRFPIKKIA